MRVEGDIRPPGDKSISHRALLLAAVARGRSELREVLAAADTRGTARVLRQLGAEVSSLRGGRHVTVRGGAWRRPGATLHCGNSGTTARLLIGLLAGHRFPARLTGDASLRGRPMRRVTEPLERMGARFAPPGGDVLPLTVRGGGLVGLRYRSPVASAQVKSAVLLAGLSGGVDVTVEEPAPSRDHTERLLRFLGASIDSEAGVVRFPASSFPRWRLRPFRLTVPGDFSSAAFLVAAALLADRGELRVRGVGINATRTGALGVLERMGARVDVERPEGDGGEIRADLVVRPAVLRGTVVSPSEVPSLIDEVPVLAVLAARAEGETRFCGVAELRVKESDRLALIAGNLRTIGADAAVEGDDLIVVGSDHPLAGRVETGGDHRLAMAFAVLAALTGGAVTLSERHSVAVSYPGFFVDLATLLHG